MNVSTRPRPSRPLPHRDVAVAPPVESTSASWAAVLAEPLADGPFEWVMGAEGALVPVALVETRREIVPRRGRLTLRLRRSATMGA